MDLKIRTINKTYKLLAICNKNEGNFDQNRKETVGHFYFQQMVRKIKLISQGKADKELQNQGAVRQTNRKTVCQTAGKLGRKRFRQTDSQTEGYKGSLTKS